MHTYILLHIKVHDKYMCVCMYVCWHVRTHIRACVYIYICILHIVHNHVHCVCAGVYLPVHGNSYLDPLGVDMSGICETYWIELYRSVCAHRQKADWLRVVHPDMTCLCYYAQQKPFQHTHMARVVEEVEVFGRGYDLQEVCMNPNCIKCGLIISLLPYP